MAENIFEKEGQLLKVEGNKPVLLDNPENIWVIHSGKADIFMVHVEDGKPAGPRSHVFRADEGNALFGMDIKSYGRGFGLLVCGVTGTMLLELKKSRLMQLANESVYREQLATLIDSWISGFSTSLSGGETLPKQFIQLKTEEEISVEENVSARPEKGVMWVKQIEGTSHFVSNSRFSLTAGDKLVPVSAHTWLQSVEKSKLRAVDTSTFLEEDPSWSNLEEFHHLVINHIVLNREEAEKNERERLKNKAENDRLSLKNSLSRLTSILKTGPSVPPVSEEKDVLFQTCSLIGNRLGVTVKQHPDMKKGKKQRDPLQSIAAASRIHLRKVILKDNWWKMDNGHLLAFTKENKKPVALLSVSATSYELHDCVGGTRIRMTSSVAETLDPVAYMFYRPFPDGVIKTLDLFKIGIRGCGKDLTTVIVMGVLGGLLGLLTPIATGLIFDDIIPSAERNQLFQIALILFASTFAVGVFSLTNAIAMLRLEGRMDSGVQAAVWDRLMSLPASFFRSYTAGDLSKRAMGISEIRRLISGSTMQSVLSCIFSAFSLALLFYYSWKLALVAIGLVILGLIFTGTYSYVQVRHQRGLMQVQGKLAGMVLQLVNGISKLRVAGAESRVFNMWSKEFSRQKEIRFKVESIANMVATFNSMFPVMCSMTIFYMLIRFNSGAMTAGGVVISTGNFLAFNSAFTTFLTAMLGMTASLMSTLNIMPIYERAKPILQTLPEVDVTKSDPGELSGNIEVSHINFNYTEDGPLVLRDVSLQIQPGEFIALVGPSGSGKSTLFRLLLGFEIPSSGTVYYDGQDIAGLDVGALRRQLGVVLQNSQVMTDDIYGNIVGPLPLTRDEAWDAARMAGFDEDIKQMPMGMNTVLSQGGGTLSGGQKQRLLVARAVAHKPRIFYFDEATSALDNKTQAIVSRSLEGLKVTRIVIAHRLSTIRNADRIYLLKDGVLAESGTYDELISRDGPFAELARRQVA